jgi:DNA-binding transcriptional LysR family regulator
MDEFGDLRLFTRIVASGSLSEAARRLNMSLTVVSRRLAAIENRLRVRLIDRASRKFELTDEGRLLYARALQIVDDLETTLAELDRASGVTRGRLRISAPNEIGRRLVAPLCGEFVAKYPEVVADLSFTDSRPDVLEANLDIAVVTKRPIDGDTIHRKLIESRRVVCASPEYLARHGSPATPDDLLSHNCIRARRGDRIYDGWTFLGPDGPREYSVSGTLVTDSNDVIHQWALGGSGIAVKALWDVRADIEAGRLVEVLGDYACDEICLYATHVTRRHVPPRIRLFIDLLAERLPQLCG